VSFKNPAALRIPGTYLLAVAPGKKTEEGRFYKFYERARSRGWATFTMESDHNPEWFKPKELAVLLEQMVASPAVKK
jgi:hypothetical protein